MPNIKMAKRAVAVQACKMLYENGELNEHLMPINKNKCFVNMKSMYFSHWDEPQFVGGIIKLGISPLQFLIFSFSNL